MGKTIVETNCGRLRGTIEKSIEDYNYYAFKGVPYAKPPAGELRFEDPQPPEPWEGIKDANDFGSPCSQFDQFSRSYVGSDDCLYLNVYTKSINRKQRQPVMLWIHGGAYTFGCGDDLFYGPDYLMKNDVILVTVNYRLGIFGFLNLENEICPGNLGLKDLVMALKWIKTNIGKFGGDRNNVTIFGESSGGSSVCLLCLSPMAEGLFHKAISQSGVALNTWVSPPDPKRYAYKICKLLGKETDDPKVAIEFLRTLDCTILAKMSEKMRTHEEKIQLLYPFGPGVDEKSENPFMPIPILEAAKNGIKVPYILGYNNREGLYALAMLHSNDFKYLNDNFQKYIHPKTADILKEYDLKVPDLKTLYNVYNLTEDNYIDKFIDPLTDMYMVAGFHKLIKLLVLKNLAPVYFYKFTYDQGISFTKLIMNSSIDGASHFDELPHLFTMKFCELLGVEPLKKGTTNYRIMEQMTQMWTNFAKTGKPTPVTSKLIPLKWAPVSNPTLLRYMNIGNELSLNDMLNLEQRLIYGKNTISKL